MGDINRLLIVVFAIVTRRRLLFDAAGVPDSIRHPLPGLLALTAYYTWCRLCVDCGSSTTRDVSRRPLEKGFQLH